MSLQSHFFFFFFSKVNVCQAIWTQYQHHNYDLYSQYHATDDAAVFIHPFQKQTLIPALDKIKENHFKLCILNLSLLFDMSTINVLNH